MAKRRSRRYSPGRMKAQSWWNSRGEARNAAAHMASRMSEKNGSVRLV